MTSEECPPLYSSFERHEDEGIAKETSTLDKEVKVALEEAQCQCKTGECVLHKELSKTDHQARTFDIAGSSSINDSTKAVTTNNDTGGSFLKRKYHLDIATCTANNPAISCSSSTSKGTILDSNITGQAEELESKDSFSPVKSTSNESADQVCSLVALAITNQVDESTIKSEVKSDGLSFSKEIEQVDLNNNTLGPTQAKVAKIDYS